MAKVSLVHNWLPENLLTTGDVSDSTLIAGVDEVGRGALFGPVVAAAVMLPRSHLSQLVEIGVKDSKALSAKQRQQLVPKIQNTVQDWKVGYSTVAEIDNLNILQASLLAMRRAVMQLSPLPALCLIDGNYVLKDLGIPQKAIIKGDSRSPSIAAASIVAKVWRDDLIVNLATKYPQYDLAANKGYATKKHRLALQQYGVSAEHRRSFKPCSP